MLQQFNWSPEFYLPVSDKLAELRAQARAVAELLSRAPSVHDSYFVGDRSVKYDDLYHFEEQPSIYGLKVEGGCLWQEKLEDEVALYRELMSSPAFRYLHERLWFREGNSICSLPRSPDRLVAWNKADLERRPKVWQDFMEELKGSPDVLSQMEARALRLADIRFPDMNRFFDTRAEYEAAYRTACQTYDKELSSAFADFFDAFVTNRISFKTNKVDVLYLDWGINELVERMGGDIVTDAKESLRNQYRTEYATKLAAKDKELAPIMAASENLDAFAHQIKFLKDGQPYDPQAFVQMFIFGFKDYSREQAQEIKPLLAEYKNKLSGTWAQMGQMQVGQVEANVEKILNPTTVALPSRNRIAMTNGNPARPPGGDFSPGRPPWLGQPGTPPQFTQRRFPPDREAEPAAETPVPEPLVSSNVVTVRNFYRLPMDGLPGDKPNTFRVTDHQLVEGKVLLDFQYDAWVYSFDEKGNWRSSASKTYTGVALFDLASSRWQVAVLPDFSTIETDNRLSHHSVAWRSTLYSSNNGKVQKFDGLANKWDTNALPVSGNYQLYNLAGKFYVADYNSIQQITDDARGTKLLASVQRQPPVTRLDSLGALVNLALFTDTQNFLYAAVHDKVFRWDGSDWQEIGAASTSFQPFVFEGGVLFLTDGWNLRPARISSFETRNNIFETCLVPQARTPTQGGYSPRETDGEVLLKPLWKLPTELSLPNPSAAYWQSNLLLMADHSEKNETVAEERGTRPDGTLAIDHVVAGEKFVPKGGYNSALFCFSRGRAAAAKIRLKFDDSEGCPPMAGLGSNSQPLILQIGITKCWMLFTSKFLLCGRERLGDLPGSSEPAGFKPGIWVVPLDSIMREFKSLDQMSSSQKPQ